MWHSFISWWTAKLGQTVANWRNYLICWSSKISTCCCKLLCTVLSYVHTAAPNYCAQFCPLYTQLLQITVHSSVRCTHSCSTLLCTVLSAIHTAAPNYCAQFCPLCTLYTDAIPAVLQRATDNYIKQFSILLLYLIMLTKKPQIILELAVFIILL